MSLPFTVRIQRPEIIQIEANFTNLSISLGFSRVNWIPCVVLPLLQRPIGFAAGLTAALSLGALAVTQKKVLTFGIQQKIQAALTRAGLDWFGHYKPAQLSGGQQGRAALARVLLQDKPMLLLDEPFNALGPALKDDMLDLLQVLANERQCFVLIVKYIWTMPCGLQRSLCW